MNFYIGLSALQTSQFGMDIVSQNVANANTPGYHRQITHLEAVQTQLIRGRQIGAGVSVNFIERVRHQIIESQFTNAISDQHHVESRLNIEAQIEYSFTPGSGSIHERLDNFFNDITRLNSTASEATAVNVAVQNGVALADQFQNVASELFDTRYSVRAQLQHEVTILNRQMDELGTLTDEILISEPSGVPHGLLDKRDTLINEIAQKIDVTRLDNVDSGVGLVFGNISIQHAPEDVEFEILEGDNGELQIGIVLGDTQRELSPGSGELAGLIEIHNKVLPSFQERLDELAAGVIRNFDQVHATGVGTNGAFDFLEATRFVSDPDAPLAQSDPPFPIENGSLYFSLTAPDGSRETHSIAIDPEVDSLRDIADRIGGIPNISAHIDTSPDHKLQIRAASGYRFDFSGAQATSPDLITYSGGSVPSLSGRYSGDNSTEFNFTIVGSGNVGTSENLQVRVQDTDGNVVNEINIGVGYEAGTEIEVVDGIQIRFPAGDVVDGDTFSTTAVADPDETGILSSLGLNSFFLGTDASTIEVSDRIVDDLGNFAKTFNGDESDSRNLERMLQLRDERFFQDGSLTFDEYLNDISTDIGARVSSDKRLSESLGIMRDNFERQRNSYSGVDVNEELIRLTEFQKSYEAAVRVIQTAELMLDELFQIVG